MIEDTKNEPKSNIKKEEKMNLRKLKKKKRKIGRRIIIALVILLVIGVIAVPKLFSKEAVPEVTVVAARVGDVDETLDTSGMLVSEKEKIYYAPVTETVSVCNAVLGESVVAGDELLRFDTKESENQYNQVKLQQEVSQYEYKETLAKGNESVTDLSKSNKTIQSLKSKISSKEDDIEQIQKDLTKEKSDPTAIEKLQTKLQKAQTKLSELQLELSEEKSAKAQAEAGVLSNNQKKQLETNQELSDLSEETAAETLKKAKAGISSEFDGIVTDVQVAPGVVVTQGQPLFTIQSNEQVKVSISISKYELSKVKLGQVASITLGDSSYTGSVVKISKMGVVNDSGTPAIEVDIHVDKPDENIYLGVEAKVVIQLANAKKVITIPAEALNTGKDGEFCYVVENSIVVKKTVESGVTSDDIVEITKGIKEGDLVITDITSNLEAGIKVTTKEAQD